MSQLRPQQHLMGIRFEEINMSAVGSWMQGIPWDAGTAPSPLGTDALETNPPGLLKHAET